MIKRINQAWAISPTAKAASALPQGQAYTRVNGIPIISNVGPGPNYPPAPPPISYQNPTIPPPPPAHLYYGGSLNANTGAIGPKPHLGRHFRHQKRLELIVRMENAGLPESAIAPMLSITVNRLRHIKKSTDYLAARIKITTGLIVDQEGALAEVKAQRKEMLTQMLPTALQVIANAVNTPAITLGERRFQHEVAKDILDREGQYTRVTRAEIVSSPSFDWSVHEQNTFQILQVASTGSIGHPSTANGGASREAGAEGPMAGQSGELDSSSAAMFAPAITAALAAGGRVAATQAIIDAFRQGSTTAEEMQLALDSLNE